MRHTDCDMTRLQEGLPCPDGEYCAYAHDVSEIDVQLINKASTVSLRMRCSLASALRSTRGSCCTLVRVRLITIIAQVAHLLGLMWC